MVRRFPHGTFRLLTVAQQHPDIVKRLEEAAEVARVNLGDGSRKGRDLWPVGQL